MTTTDERWVDEPDARSNARLIRECLLLGGAAAARFIPMKNAAATPHDGAAATAAALAKIEDPYDLVILGMGDDAHVAFLFPGSPESLAGLDPSNGARCIGVTPPAPTTPSVPRLSLTLAELCNGRRVVLALAGTAKRHAFEHALRAEPGAPVAALCRHARCGVDVLWLDAH